MLQEEIDSKFGATFPKKLSYQKLKNNKKYKKTLTFQRNWTYNITSR